MLQITNYLRGAPGAFLRLISFLEFYAVERPVVEDPLLVEEAEQGLTPEMLTFIMYGATALIGAIAVGIWLLKKDKKKKNKEKLEATVRKANEKVREKRRKENATLKRVLDQYAADYADEDMPDSRKCCYTAEAEEAAKRVRRPKKAAATADTPEVMIDTSGVRDSFDEEDSIRRHGISVSDGEIGRVKETVEDDISVYDDRNISNEGAGELNTVSGEEAETDGYEDTASSSADGTGLPPWAMALQEAAS